MKKFVGAIGWTAWLLVCYGVGCWGAYRWGKFDGKNEAYDECTTVLKKSDEDLRAKYPSVFGG